MLHKRNVAGQAPKPKAATDRHIRAHNKNTAAYKCDPCYRTLAGERNLDGHLLRDTHFQEVAPSISSSFLAYISSSIALFIIFDPFGRGRLENPWWRTTLWI